MTALVVALMAAFGLWTWASYSRNDVIALFVALAGVLALLLALVAHGRGRHLVAFWLNALAALSYVTSIFIALYPNALPSTVDMSYDLTLADAAASQTSLQVITVIAAVGLPLVMAYQAWSFWVFRKRISPTTVTE